MLLHLRLSFGVITKLILLVVICKAVLLTLLLPTTELAKVLNVGASICIYLKKKVYNTNQFPNKIMRFGLNKKER